MKWWMYTSGWLEVGLPVVAHMTAVLIAKDRVDLQSRHVADQSSVVPLSEVGCQLIIYK